jgi:RND family efflux transporter MFP subunit
MKKLLKKYLPLWIILGSSLVATMMISAKPKAKANIQKFIPPVVETQIVISQEYQVRVESQGTVVPRTEIQLMSEVSGKIQKVSSKLQTGAKFEIGDPLIYLEKRDFELSLISAESSLSQARVNYEREKAESELAAKEWKKINGGKASDLTLRKPQLLQAKAILAAAEAIYEQAERNLNRTTIRAPFKGRVRKKMVDVGMVVSPGLTIAQIYATDYVEISLPIAEQDLAFLGIPLDGSFIEKKYQPYVELFTEFGGEELSWSGTIVRSSAEIDSKTRMLSVIAQVSDPYQKTSNMLPLKVGIFVKAAIKGKTFNNLIKIPRFTVRDNKVWVVNQEGILDQKQIKILRYENDTVLVSEGLDSSDSILLTRLTVLIKGMKLKKK